MAIDVDKLLRFSVPSVRHTLTARDAAFYALSVGIAQDPLDRRQLRFADPDQGPVALPSMPLVMAHPGFWLGNPESGVDPASVLHGGQKIEILAPIPVKGEVESRTRVTGVSDKGHGKAALIFTETELRDAEHHLFARLERTTFIRNGGGFGGSSTPFSAEPAVPPDRAADTIVDLQTRPEQALYYRLNGDLNPLHSAPDVAAKAGFAAPILHGLCTMGVITHALLRGALGYQADRLQSISLRFASPVLPGETIRTEIWADGTFRARVVERDVVVADQGCFSIHSSPSTGGAQRLTGDVT